MALFQIDYFSESLARQTRIQLLLPNDLPDEMKANNPAYLRNSKTLFLLHGYSGCGQDWLFGSNIWELSAKYNLAVVMPSCENSFYMNWKGKGQAYAHYVGKELPKYISDTFSLSSKTEDVYIGGISMGGFGAIHTGLRYPQTFGKIVGLSSALIVENISGIKPGFSDKIADYDYYVQIFGDLDSVVSSEGNPIVLVRHLKENGQVVPSIYMACGTEDFLINENRTFRDALVSQGVNVHYCESPGIHDWQFWNQYLEDSILWLLQ